MIMVPSASSLRARAASRSACSSTFLARSKTQVSSSEVSLAAKSSFCEGLGCGVSGASGRLSRMDEVLDSSMYTRGRVARW